MFKFENMMPVLKVPCGVFAHEQRCEVTCNAVTCNFYHTYRRFLSIVTHHFTDLFQQYTSCLLLRNTEYKHNFCSQETSFVFACAKREYEPA